MKKFYLFSLVAVLIVSLGISLSALGINLPIVEIIGSKFYVYETKKGDTFFSIADKNNWDVAELQRVNPEAASPFKKGTHLFYPVNFNTADSLASDSLNNTNVSANNANQEKLPDLFHNVVKGETVYSISQLYKIPVETIYALNPSARYGVKPGEKLTLRSSSGNSGINSNTEPLGAAHFHTVAADESLRSVANENNVSVSAILEANPGISQANFKEGENIIIPEKGTGIVTETAVIEELQLDNFTEYQVTENETWESISEKTGVDLQMIKDMNPGVKALKKNQIIAIPHLITVKRDSVYVAEDPRQTTYVGVNEIYNDLHKVADTADKHVIRYAIIAESPTAKKDLEFIRGFLTGINELRYEPYKLNVKVIDGTKTGAEIVTELDDYHPTLVFTTADKSIPSYLSEYASISQTPVVNTFDVKNEEYTVNPYFIQLLTPSNYFNDCVAENAHEVHGSYKLVMIGEEDESDQLAAALKKLWEPENIKYLPTQAYEALDLSNSEGILFYGYPTKKEDVENILTNITTIRENNPNMDIAVLGRPNWIVFNESLKPLLFSANTSIPSRFYIDEGSVQNQRFIAEYKDLFKRAPLKTVPLYAGVGYDTALYFTKALEKSSLDINNLAPSKTTLQSQFDLKRVSNWGGFLNRPVYLVQYSPLQFTSFVVIE